MPSVRSTRSRQRMIRRALLSWLVMRGFTPVARLVKRLASRLARPGFFAQARFSSSSRMERRRDG